MDFFQFSLPTKIVFNEGLAKDFSAELDLIPVNKYFIVTDKVLSDLKIIDPIVEGLKESGREVTGIFTEVPSDSGVRVIDACAKAIKASGSEAIIAVGGGSVLDTAKGANILFSLGGDLVEDYSGAQTITQDLSPLIAIPTTAGTGSEVTEAIVVLDEETQTKLSFVDSHLLPALAILDPELTVGLPPKMTAATALDALTHAVEAVMSVQRGPLSDALAFQSIRMIFENMKVAIQDGKNLEARGALLIASTTAGIAFNHAMVGVVHSLAHTLGGLFHVHHGTANGIFLPYGMEYNLEVREKEIASLAPYLGLVSTSSCHETALNCIQVIKKLLQEVHQLCDLPVTLEQANIREEDFQTIAEKTPEDGSSFYNPREVITEDLLPFIERAFSGE